MKISQVIPQLRRYARALTGSQSAGDAYVAAMLEVLVADDKIDDEVHSNPKIGLFRAFQRVWGSLATNELSEPIPRADITDGEPRLDELSPRMRQVYLLHAMEKFTPKELAEVFETSVESIDELISDCEAEVSSQLATGVLVIEDEPLIAMDISNIVRAMGHTVAGLAKTRKQAVELANQKDFGLILADIRLADDSSGIDAVNDITAEKPCPTIFITAYPERLLTGLRPEPTFLITKPFDPQEVRAMVSQVLFMRQVTKSAVEAA